MKGLKQKLKTRLKTLKLEGYNIFDVASSQQHKHALILVKDSDGFELLTYNSGKITGSAYFGACDISEACSRFLTELETWNTYNEMPKLCILDYNFFI